MRTPRRAGTRGLVALLAIAATAAIGPSTGAADPSPAPAGRSPAAWSAASPTTLPAPSTESPTAGALATGAAIAGFALPAPDALATLATSPVDDTIPVAPPAADGAAIMDAAFDAADRMPAADWELDALVAALDYDPDRAFAFVRDRIGLDPYPGVLRGAEGTLAARAGNSWDRAALLAALLQRMLIPVRFAYATLDDATAARVVARSLVPPADPLPRGEPTAVLGVDAVAVAARARRDAARVLGALGDRFDAATVSPDADALAAVRDHAWVRAYLGTGWVDLDPTLPDAQPGQPIGASGTTSPTIPPEQRHAVRLRLDATTLAPGATGARREPVLDVTLDPATAAGSAMYLYFQPEATGMGARIGEVMTGDARWMPVLLVDGVATPGSGFSAGGRGTDLFGDATPAPELVSLELTIIATAPGTAPEQVGRILVDRLPAGTDPAAPLDLADLAPLALDGEVPAFTSRLHHVLLSTGGTSPRESAIGLGAATWFAGTGLSDPDRGEGYALGDQLWPVEITDRMASLATDTLVVPGLTGRTDLRAFVDRPRVSLFTIGLGQGPGGASFAVDLALDGIGLVGDPGVAAVDVARARLWYGAVESALETQLTLDRAAALVPKGRSVDSLSLRMGGHAGPAEGAPLTVIDPGGTPPTDAPSDLRTALGAGDLAILPPAGPSGAPDAYWSIDPATGRTRAISPTGLRGGYLVGGEYVNSTFGDTSYVIDQATGETLGYVRNGTYYRYARPAPQTCRGGDSTGYITILSCVSVPGSWALGIGVGATVVAAVTWAYVILTLISLAG